MIRTRLGQIIRFSRYLLPYWDKEITIIICRAFSALIGLGSPFLAKLTFDYAYNNRDLQVFNVLVLAGGIVWAGSGLLGVIQQYIEAYIQHRLDLDIRGDYYQHLQKLSLRFFQSRSTGEQMYRTDADIQGVSSFIVSTIPTLLITALQLAALLAISLWLHWRLTFLIVGIAPLFYLHAHYFGNKQRAIFKQVVEKSQQISSELQEAISHTRLIKAFGREKTEARRYIRRWIESIRLGFDRLRMSIYASTTGSLLNTAVVTGISYYMGYQLIRGGLTLGTLIALSLYLFQLLGILKSLGGLYSGIVIRFVSIDRLLETLDAPIEIADAPGAIELANVERAIAFQGVTFGYEAGKTVLEDITLHVQPGQTVALVGPSGAGKTTLISLLLRFYDPWVGMIAVDGHDIRRVKARSLRQMIGVALQDALLMNCSVQDNILYGQPEATEEEAIAAAMAADAHEFIQALPRGYNTVIGEEGCVLSEGQKQRIAIARALLKKPCILVLDEAMSSISSSSEHLILQALARSRERRITILASHRLSTIRHADRIYVLHEGRVVEEGTHDELVAARGAYCRLFAEQLESAGETVEAAHPVVAGDE